MIRAWRIMTMMLGLAVAGGSVAVEYEECPIEVDWQSIYDSESGIRNPDDYYFDLAEDLEGNILACGTQAGLNVGTQWRVAKYGPNGSLLWVDNWAPSEGSFDSMAMKTAATSEGCFVVAGMCLPHGTVAVRKYDTNGAVLWTYTTGGEYYLFGSIGLAVNEDGEVYVGYTPQETFPYYVNLLKLTPDGVLAWSKKTGIVSDVWDLSCVSDGQIVGIGRGYSEVLSNDVPVAFRFDRFGEIKWVWKDEEGKGGEFYNLAVDKERGYFYSLGRTYYNETLLVKFPDDPAASTAVPEWIARDNYGGFDLAVDSSGDIWTTGGGWSIRRLNTSLDPDVPPEVVCSTVDYDWIEEHGLHPKASDGEGVSNGFAVICTRDGGLASCGFLSDVIDMDSEVVKFMPSVLHGTGPGPVANGSPTEPGPEHPGGLKPGDVRVAGGTRGLVDPRRGEGASISVYPTSAGTVTLTVIDRKGGVVKQVSVPVPGAGTVTLAWDGKNTSGAPVAPGIYAVRVEGPGIKQVSKVAVVY